MAKKFELSQNVHSEKLIELLPHKSKMFLLDHLVHHDTAARTLESISLITKENIFYDEEIGGVPSHVAFELIAQSISALSGVTGYEMGVKPKPGFLLSLINYSANVPFFKTGTSIHVKIKKVDEIENILTYYGEAFSSENPETSAVSTTVTVMETEDLNILRTK